MKQQSPLEIAADRARSLTGEINLAAKKTEVAEVFDLMIQANVELGEWFERYEAELIAPIFMPCFMALGMLLDALERRLQTEGGPNQGYMLSVMAEIKTALLEMVDVGRDEGTKIVDRRLS